MNKPLCRERRTANDLNNVPRKSTHHRSVSESHIGGGESDYEHKPFICLPYQSDPSSAPLSFLQKAKVESELSVLGSAA